MKKTIIILKSLTVICGLNLFTNNFVNAQKNGPNTIRISEKNLPEISKTSVLNTFYADFNSENISSDFLHNHLSEWLKTDSNHKFELVRSTTDELGIKHLAFQHFYKNIKVADELILIHEKNQKIIYVNGEFTSNINLSVNAPLPELQLKNIIAKDMKSSRITYSAFEQVVTKVLSRKVLQLSLVSKIDAFSMTDLKGYTYFIDDNTGLIVKKLEKIHYHGKNLPKLENTAAQFIDTPSVSATFYKNNQQITVDSYNGGYRLKDNSRNIHTFNGTGWDRQTPVGGHLTGSTDYTNIFSNFTTDETKPAVEVHWAMKNSYDYYLTRHGRSSYDGNGSLIKNYYHINFADAGDPYYGAQAAAVDMPGFVGMLYGNGILGNSSSYFNPFVGLDVAGHEYSHLIISRTADLAYQGESGALNESFADIFGTAIEFYSGVNPNWTIGEGIPKPVIGAFLRSMSNPNAGPSILNSQQPDTYLGNYWMDTSSPEDDGGVHTNSGVGNFWFYLLSMGGSGTNDLGNNYNVSGITIEKAEKIAYRTLANYLTANSQYIDAYNASRQAVTDLYGAMGSEQQQNVNAWYAVGIDSGTLSASESLYTHDNINIYPNPVTNGVLIVENNNENAFFEIYDMPGRVVKKKQPLQPGIHKIQVSELEKGVYIFKITAKGLTTSKKIIIR